MSDNEKCETHADIIAEMHRFAKQHEYDHPDMDTNARGIEDYADRLEAAHERELAASGDAAKLREALTDAEKTLYDSSRSMYGIPPHLHALLARIRAALAAPPRNCDRFASVDEARKAHEAICEKYGKCHHGCPLNNEEHYSAFDCFEAWLFAPATEQKGGEE